MSLPQRIVVVVALALILWIVGRFLTAHVPFSGWVAYAPLSQRTIPTTRLFVARDGLGPVANLFVWLGLVLAWCGGALLLFSDTLRRRPHAVGSASGAPSAPERT